MSATTETAPESCPFCGASRKPGCGFAWFTCGTMTAPTGNNRRDQTPTCADAERARLTRERDEASALAARRGEVLEKLVSKASANLASAGIQEGELSDRIEWVCAIKKQLESDWAGWPDLQREWFGGKYAAMQPFEAVRARIEDSEDRIKRLEEAGGFMAYNENVDFDELVAAWEKAKEAKP